MKMNINRLDKLFNERLKEIEYTPSTAAWEKLESQLNQNKKRKPMVWYGVAAAIVLLITASVLWISTSNDHATELVVENGKVDKSSTESSNDLQNDGSIEQPTEATNKVEHQQLTSVVSPIEQSVEEVNQSAKEDGLPEGTKHSTETENGLLIAEAPDALNVRTTPGNKIDELPIINPVPNNVKVKRSSTMMTASANNLPDVKIMYKSDKKDVPENKGVEKILALAKEVKSLEFGLGTLREVKNELIARNINKVNNRNINVDKQD